MIDRLHRIRILETASGGMQLGLVETWLGSHSSCRRQKSAEGESGHGPLGGVVAVRQRRHGLFAFHVQFPCKLEEILCCAVYDMPLYKHGPHLHL